MTIPSLLPCPFCGGTASLDDSVGGAFVSCDLCEAQGPFVKYEGFPDPPTHDEFLQLVFQAKQKAEVTAAAAWNQRSAWQHPREGTEMADNEFNALCDAHGFSAVARGEFPLVPRNLLKALVDAAVLAERELSAWQPIETAPRDGTEILVWNGSERQILWWSDPLNGWTFNDEWEVLEDLLTHWQPLPSPPPITPPPPHAFTEGHSITVEGIQGPHVHLNGTYVVDSVNSDTITP